MTLPLYPKIDSVFKRDPENNHKTFLVGEWTNPVFELLKDIEWVGTEKVDGTNTRIHILPPQTSDEVPRVEVGGKTHTAQLHFDLVNTLLDIGKRALSLDDERYYGLTLFGEGYGAGIQRGGIYRPDMAFILFDVYDSTHGIWLESENVVDIGDTLGIPSVPPTFVGSLGQAVWHFENHRPITFHSPLTNQNNAEGWVLRPARELRDRMGNRVITKIKVKDFA